MYSTGLDVFLITETWLTDSIYDSEFLPNGYSVYRLDRNSRGGGVAIVTKSTLYTSVHSSPSHGEAITIKLHPNLLITCIYISPTCLESDFISTVHYLKEITSCSAYNHLIIGDFNAPDIDWSICSAASYKSKTLCDLIFELNLHQLMLDPTHIQGNILDLILTDAPEHVTNVRVHSHNDMSLHSDHYVISLSFLLHQPSPIYRAVPTHSFLFSKADWSGLCDFLFDSNLTENIKLSDVDSMWKSLKEVILNGCNKYIPRMHFKKSQLPKWFTPNIHHSLNKVRTLRKRTSRKHYPPSMVAKLQEMESSLQTMITNSKRDYEYNLIKNSSKDKKEVFRHIKSITSKYSSPNTVYWNSSYSSNPAEKCDLFNRFFNSVFIDSRYKPPRSLKQPHPTSQLSHIFFSEDDVSSALTSLDLDKAIGPDGIGPKLLRECAAPLTAPLMSLFNACINQGSIPNEWKTHLIVPILKSGDKADVTNYRPISLLCTVSKVLESLIYWSMIDFVRPRLSHQQFGFLENRSCVHKLLLLLYSVTNSIDRKYQTDVIFLDLRKAFDTVCHKELLFKLSTLGISEPLLSWFHCYLSDRVHKVRFDGCESSYLPV